MKTAIFSFGQGHAHRVGNFTYDKDVLVQITAEDPRQVMVDAFGIKWSMEYTPEKAQKALHHFPRGIHVLQ